MTTEPAPTQVHLSGRWPVPSSLLVVAAVVVLAWLGSGLRPHTWPSTALVVTTALGVGILALRRTRSRAPTGTQTRRRVATPRLRRAVICWAVLLAAALMWETYAFIHQPAWNVSSADYPTLSVLLDPLLELRPVRFVAWLAWLGAGFRLARP
ncbi:hypothetical protein ABN034_01745 [Actinopolymorpha sp. B11F2]|uniref:hypothetical protein n=1 Tax=Actinopolymorpha sp. B11F2 TaxID=3160862 RepID=UPI0032E4799A